MIIKSVLKIERNNMSYSAIQRKSVDIRIKRHVTKYYESDSGKEIKDPKEVIVSESLQNNIGIKEALKMLLDEL